MDESRTDGFYEITVQMLTNHPDTTRKVVRLSGTASSEVFHDDALRQETERAMVNTVFDAIRVMAGDEGLPALQPIYIKLRWTVVNTKTSMAQTLSERYLDLHDVL